MGSSPVLGLASASWAAVVPGGYAERLDLENTVTGNAAKVDAWAGTVTGSMFLDVFISGALDSKEGQVVKMMYTPIPLVLKELVAVAAHSGAAGVTSVDIQKQDTVGGAFGSVFLNAAAMAKVSSSLGDFSIGKANSFKSNSGSLGAGMILKVVLNTVAQNQQDLSIQLFFAPSASYGT
jgi:hypothetical protein